MINVLDAAKFFLWLASQQENELISNLKLQKLLYYAQGYNLARYEVPLFDAPIKCWDHGPVIEEVYQEYKNYGDQAIPAPVNIQSRRYPDEERNLMTEVYGVYGRFSAWTLRNMTHDEPLWQNVKRGNVIPMAQLKEFFITRIEIEPRIVQTPRRSWNEVTGDLLRTRRALWEKLAKI